MREYDRVVPLSEFENLVERFGWRKTPSASGKEIYLSKTSAFLNAPWDFGGHEIKVLFRPEGIRWISVLLTELIYPPTAESRLFTQDVFAEYVAIAGELLGKPTRTIAGETQELRWAGSTATIALINTGARVSADLAPNTYYEDRDIAIEVDS
jgi:hypothetical protein